MECPTRRSAQKLYKYFQEYIKADENTKHQLYKFPILYKGYKLILIPQYQNRTLVFQLIHNYKRAYGVYVPRFFYALYKSGHIYNARSHYQVRVRSKEYRRAYRLYMKLMLKLL